MSAETGLMLWRLFLCSLSAFLIGITFVISWGYYQEWRRRAGDWTGLLPLHVCTLTLSYNLLLFSATIEVVSRAGGEVHATWRSIILLPAYLLGLYSMYVLRKLRKRRGLDADKQP